MYDSMVGYSPYPLIVPLDRHPQDVSLKVSGVWLAGGGEGVVEPVELGPGEGVGVLLHEAQVDGGGETGLPREVRGWQSQTDHGEEKYHGDNVRPTFCNCL